MTRTRLLAIRAVAFLISFLSMVFIATNTGDRFDTVLLNGRLVGEAADTANAFAIGMSPIGHMFKLLFVDMGPMGPALLILLAFGSMWLGYRFSRPSDSQLSIGRPPKPHKD